MTFFMNNGLRTTDPPSPKSANSGLWRAGQGQRRRGAFTLVELLVVLVVISIMAGITLSVSKFVSWRAKQAQSEAELQKIKNALEEYRAVYGEYPIVGDLQHYGFPANGAWPTNISQPAGWNGKDVPGDTSTNTFSNAPPEYRVVDLISPKIGNDGKTYYSIEILPFGSGITNDFRLVYPLKIRPELEGRAAFMNFSPMTVCHLVWKGGGTDYESKDDEGNVFVFLKGNPINRFRAVDPVTGKQWFYDCTNGTTYTLSSTNGFL